MAMALHASPGWPMGLAAGPGWTGSGLRAQVGTDRFCFFRNYFPVQNKLGKPQKMFKGTENTQKIPKNPGKFPEID
jgi:hypothetical protein